jgi:hypothetical protein
MTMHLDRRITFLLFLAASALALAAIPAADLIKDIPMAGKWIISAICVLAAFGFFVRAAIIAWQDEKAAPTSLRKRKMIGLVGMTICGLGFIAFAAFYFWPSAASQSKHQAYTPPPTFQQIFESDFPHVLKGKTEYTFTNKTDGAVRKIIEQVYYDFEGKSEFFGFFLPTSPDSYDIAHHLVDNYDVVIGELKSKVQVRGGMTGDSSTTKDADLMFSGRIYIYHQDEWGLAQKAELERLFKEKGVSVQLRGPDYYSFQIVTGRK